jgi:putative FmdB family regulatory protein
MPTYSYECSTCKQEFEKVQKISDPPAKHCETPGCPGTPKRTIPSSTSFVLVGKGWYRDGY